MATIFFSISFDFFYKLLSPLPYDCIVTMNVWLLKVVGCMLGGLVILCVLCNFISLIKVSLILYKKREVCLSKLTLNWIGFVCDIR